jgi:hypothetical protein
MGSCVDGRAGILDHGGARRPARIRAGAGPAHRSVQADIADAFRAAFPAIAGFTPTGHCLALSIPLRRI